MSKPELSAERARELFSYDPETGELRWRVNKGSRALPGKLAGTSRTDGYLQVNVDQTLHFAHRLAWLIHTGRWPEPFIDHVNGCRSDNRVCNLREATRRLNQENMRHARTGSLTGLQGVSPKRGKFRARITVEGEERNLGAYDTAQQAHEVYLTAKRELHAGCTI